MIRPLIQLCLQSSTSPTNVQLYIEKINIELRRSRILLFFHFTFLSPSDFCKCTQKFCSFLRWPTVKHESFIGFFSLCTVDANLQYCNDLFLYSVLIIFVFYCPVKFAILQRFFSLSVAIYAFLIFVGTVVLTYIYN